MNAHLYTPLERSAAGRNFRCETPLGSLIQAGNTVQYEPERLPRTVPKRRATGNNVGDIPVITEKKFFDAIRKVYSDELSISCHH